MKTTDWTKEPSGLHLLEQFKTQFRDVEVHVKQLVELVKNLTATNARLEAIVAERNEELEVLRKAVADGGRFLLDTANLYAAGRIPECRSPLSMAAIALGVELQWPKTGPIRTDNPLSVEALQAAADRCRKRVSGYTPEERSELLKQGKSAVASLAPDPSSLTPSEQWHDAQKTPPKVSHAVIGLVNGTTKTRAVYYMAKTGKWVDVNDRPVTVSQWRHL